MLAYIKKVGADLYVVLPAEGPTDPGFGQDGGAHPDQGLPGDGLHPGNRPPGSGAGGRPDNSLPGLGAPPTLLPGWTLAAVRGADGQWHFATMAPGSAPPRPLPSPIPPGGLPDQGLPPQPPEHPSGQPVPVPTPTAARPR